MNNFRKFATSFGFVLLVCLTIIIALFIFLPEDEDQLYLSDDYLTSLEAQCIKTTSSALDSVGLEYDDTELTSLVEEYIYKEAAQYNIKCISVKYILRNTTKDTNTFETALVKMVTNKNSKANEGDIIHVCGNACDKIETSWSNDLLKVKTLINNVQSSYTNLQDDITLFQHYTLDLDDLVKYLNVEDVEYDKLEKCLSTLKAHLTEYIDKHNEDSSTVEENKRLSVLKDSVEKLDTLISDISKIVDTQTLSEDNATSNCVTAILQTISDYIAAEDDQLEKDIDDINTVLGTGTCLVCNLPASKQQQLCYILNTLDLVSNDLQTIDTNLNGLSNYVSAFNKSSFIIHNVEQLKEYRESNVVNSTIPSVVSIITHKDDKALQNLEAILSDLIEAGLDKNFVKVSDVMQLVTQNNQSFSDISDIVVSQTEQQLSKIELSKKLYLSLVNTLTEETTITEGYLTTLQSSLVTNRKSSTNNLNNFKSSIQVIESTLSSNFNDITSSTRSKYTQLTDKLNTIEDSISDIVNNYSKYPDKEIANTFQQSITDLHNSSSILLNSINSDLKVLGYNYTGTTVDTDTQLTELVNTLKQQQADLETSVNNYMTGIVSTETVKADVKTLNATLIANKELLTQDSSASYDALIENIKCLIKELNKGVPNSDTIINCLTNTNNALNVIIPNICFDAEEDISE